MYQALKKNLLSLLLAIACAAISLFFFMRLQLTLAQVIDQALAGSLLENLGILQLVFTYLIFYEVLNYAYKILQSFFVRSTVENIQNRFFSVVLQQNIWDFEKHSQGELLAKFTNQINDLENQFFMPLATFFIMFLQAVFVLYTLFTINYQIALVSAFLFSLGLLAPKVLEAKLGQASKEKMLAFESHLEDFQNWLANMELIQNFNIAGKIFPKYQDSNRLYFSHSWDFEKINAKSSGLAYLVSLLSRGLIIIYAGYLVFTGQLSAGLFFTVLALMEKLAAPLFWLAKKYQEIIAAMPIIHSLKSFLSSQPADKEDPSKKKTLPAPSPGQPVRLVYEDVGFAYDDQPLLERVNMTFAGHKKYLIQGPSGCGKTTALKLLLGHYPLKAGRICLDGHNIKDLTNVSDFVSYSSQEAVFFQDNLRNNLSLYEEVDDEQLFYYLEQLGLDKFANKASLDAVLAEDAMNFSGGEKKRLSLARTLIKKKPLMVFDEPLANIDPDNVGLIEDFLLSIEDATIIIITHQFSEDKLAAFDGIYHFEKGEAYEKISL